MENYFKHIRAYQADDDLPLILNDSGYQKCESLHSFGPCARNHYLIHYIVSGHGSYSVGGKTYSLGPGDGFLIRPFVPAYYIADKDDPWEYYWAGFSGKFSGTMAEKINFSRDKVLFHNPDTVRLSHIFGHLSKLWESGYNPMSNVGYLYLMFSEITLPDVERCDSYSKMTDYISRNYMYPIDMKQLSNLTNFSHSQVYRLFMKYSDQSPQMYILNYRLDRAQELLTNTNMNISDISFSCGFSSPAYFSKSFRQKTGYTPSGYRSYARDNRKKLETPNKNTV